MSETPRLGLKLILPDQAQKHVTHNEALASLDGLVQLAFESRSMTEPPAEPETGAAYLCPAGASGEWAGHDGEAALFTEGGWRFHVPATGWRAWIADEGALAVRESGTWRVVAGDRVERIGINAESDGLNRLSARTEAALLSAIGAPESGDIRLKLNKEGEGDTASLLFQTGFSGRAEIGLAGNDVLGVKVSADGASWTEAITIDGASGAVAFPKGVSRLPGLLLDETWAAIAAMPVPPRRQRSFLLDDTIAALIDEGIWAKLDLLYLLAAHDSDAASVNIRRPGANRLAASGAPAFAADRGFTGDGVGALLSTGFVPAAASGAMAADDAHIGVWVLAGGAADAGAIGTPGASGASLDVAPRTIAGNAEASLNDEATALGAAVADALGHTVASRTPGGGRALYRGGAAIGSDATAASALPDAAIAILASDQGFGPWQVAAAHAGAGLDAGEAAALQAILAAHLGEIGAI